MSMQLVETKLKEMKLWLPEYQREKIANEAHRLYVYKDYSSEENAIDDLLANLNPNDFDILKNFEMKLIFKDGKLTVNYCDGSDTETIHINDINEILEATQTAVTTAIAIEDN